MADLLVKFGTCTSPSRFNFFTFMQFSAKCGQIIGGAFLWEILDAPPPPNRNWKFSLIMELSLPRIPPHPPPPPRTGTFHGKLRDLSMSLPRIPPSPRLRFWTSHGGLCVVNWCVETIDVSPAPGYRLVDITEERENKNNEAQHFPLSLI